MQIPFYISIIFVSSIVVILHKILTGGNFLSRISFALIVGTISFAILSLKHYSFHYLLPTTYFLLPLSTISIYITFKNFLLRNSLAILMVILIFYNNGFINNNNLHINNLLRIKEKQEKLISERENVVKDGTLIYAYYSSAVEYALAFGNGFANFSYRENLSSLYTNYLEYNIWNGYFYSMNGTIDYKELLHRKKPIYITGSIDQNAKEKLGFIDKEIRLEEIPDTEDGPYAGKLYKIDILDIEN